VSSPSPEQREYAALLITKATGDQHAAHALAQAAAAPEIIGFHAQQAVEKSIKAILVLAGVPLPRIHDLERLLTLALDTGWPAPPDVADAAWLTPWAVQYRYDEVLDAVDQDAALALADAALRWALEAVETA
jgi:HEPN domain-containing protein